MSGDNELARCVRRTLERYFNDLDGETPTGVYDMVIQCVEKPLLEVILDHTGGNQTVAADILGMNRNTLRKKIQAHRIKTTS